MSSMLPILSLMLSEAGASLMGQLAVEDTAAVVLTSSTATVSAAAEVAGTGAARPSAPRCTSTASRCLQACKCFW